VNSGNQSRGWLAMGNNQYHLMDGWMNDICDWTWEGELSGRRKQWGEWSVEHKLERTMRSIRIVFL
jgi:hypothetical protein